MKYLILIAILLYSNILYADLFDADPVKLCTLFNDEGVITTDYGPVSDSNGKLCYTQIDDKEWKDKGYRLDYRVLGYWKWTELTGNAFISVEGLESRIIEDDVLSKYKRMVYKLMNNVAMNVGEDKLSKITNAIIIENETRQNIDAISITSYVTRKIYTDRVMIKYRVNINNQCMYHPNDTTGFRTKCLARYKNITFSDRSSSDSEKFEEKFDHVYPSTREIAVKSIGSKLLFTVTSNADTSSVARNVGTISFNKNKKYVLTGFLYSLKSYLKEYENITLSFKAEDIPYAEVDDYHNVTLSQLLSDIDKKNMITIKQSASDIIILRDW